jgi:hypothetical protein
MVDVWLFIVSGIGILELMAQIIPALSVSTRTYTFCILVVKKIQFSLELTGILH